MIVLKQLKICMTLFGSLIFYCPIDAQSEFSNITVQEVDPYAPEVCKFNDGQVTQYSIEYDKNDSISKYHLQFVYDYDSVGKLISKRSGFEPAIASIDGKSDDAKVFIQNYADTVIAYTCTTQNFIYDKGRLQRIEYELPIAYFRFKKPSVNQHFPGQYNVEKVYGQMDQLLSKQVYYQKRLMYTVNYEYEAYDAPGNLRLTKVARKSANGNYMITYIDY